MPRYFFNMQDGADSFADPEGAELSNDATALREAELGAIDLLAEAIRARRPIKHASLDVVNAAGQMIGSIRFADLIL